MQHILLLEDFRLKLFGMIHGKIKFCTVFETDEQGLIKFSDYIGENFIKSVRLLIDIIDEEFHLDTIPHVFGKDRKALQQRRLDKYFHGSVHRYIKVQSRQENTRKDDQILISGINDIHQLKLCLDILDNKNVALNGIYSLPLLVEKMLEIWSIEKGTHLLISQQSISNTRHSLYVDGQLKISRLIQFLDNDCTASSEITGQEVSKTIQFLKSKRLLMPNEIIKLHYLGQKQQGRDLNLWLARNNKTNFENIFIHFLSDDQEYADVIFVEHLAQQRWPKNHYANNLNLSLYRHQIALSCLNYFALAILLITFFIGLYFSYLERIQSRKTLELISEADKYWQRYENRKFDIATLQVKVANMQYSVEALDQLQLKYQQLPQHFMLALARSSNNFKNIYYSDIDWSVKEVMGNQEAPFFATISGGFLVDNKPRKALQEVDKLIVKLRQQPGFNIVKALKMPFDLDSNSEFKMNGKERKNKASFIIRIEGALL